MNLTVATPTIGKKCTASTYISLMEKAVAAIPGDVKTVRDAKDWFWKSFASLSAEYHTGSAGIAKYSAPFLAAFDQHFAAVPTSAPAPATSRKASA